MKNIVKSLMTSLVILTSVLISNQAKAGEITFKFDVGELDGLGMTVANKDWDNVLVCKGYHYADDGNEYSFTGNKGGVVMSLPPGIQMLQFGCNGPGAADMSQVYFGTVSTPTEISLDASSVIIVKMKLLSRDVAIKFSTSDTDANTQYQLRKQSGEVVSGFSTDANNTIAVTNFNVSDPFVALLTASGEEIGEVVPANDDYSLVRFKKTDAKVIYENRDVNVQFELDNNSALHTNGVGVPLNLLKGNVEYFHYNIPSDSYQIIITADGVEVAGIDFLITSNVATDAAFVSSGEVGNIAGATWIKVNWDDFSNLIDLSKSYRMELRQKPADPA